MIIKKFESIMIRDLRWLRPSADMYDLIYAGRMNLATAR